MGTPNIRIGTTRAMVATLFITPSMEIAANKKPKSKAPVSPIKILAGLKL